MENKTENFNEDNMNDKDNEMYRILDIVVSCCATEIREGEFSISAEDVLGKSRNENVCMARCILVNQLIWAGYTVSTISSLLGRTQHAVRHIKDMNTVFVKSSRAYRLALSEATLKCKNIDPHGI